MDIGTSGDLWEEVGCKCHSEGVTHGVYKNVWDEEGESFVDEDDTANGLPQEREVRPCRGKDIVSL